MITNSNSDYSITVDGYAVEVAPTFQAARSYKIVDDGTTVGSLIGIKDQQIQLRAFDNYVLKFISQNGRMEFDSSGGYTIVNLPSTDPNIFGRLFTRTATQLGGSGSTRVLCVSSGP